MKRSELDLIVERDPMINTETKEGLLMANTPLPRARETDTAVAEAEVLLSPRILISKCEAHLEAFIMAESVQENHLLKSKSMDIFRMMRPPKSESQLNEPNLWSASPPKI